MKWILFTIAFLFTQSINPSFAQDQTQPLSNKNNHDGFFLRTLLGFGQTEFTEEIGDDLIISGLSAECRVQIGYCLFDNFILHGDLGGVFVLNPTVTYGSDPTINDENWSLVISDIGGGVTYYLMPTNIYLSCSALFSAAFAKFGMTKHENNSGPGLYLSIGKEWWISEEWGIGVTLFGSYRSMKHKNNNTDPVNPISTHSFGLAFSATFN